MPPQPSTFPPPCYGLDIETDTTVDGLDPACAAIVAVAVATEDGDSVLVGDEAELLGSLDELLADLEPGLIVTWNGSSFDFPFIEARAERLGLHLGLRTSVAHSSEHASIPGQHQFRWWGHSHLDGYRLYRADVARALGISCGLKPLSRLIGLTPVEVDRARIHELNPTEMSSYVASDARLARELVLRRMPAALANVDPAPIEGL